jgi:gamma-glutamyl-gamma-aminobutyrate hydrolase PuuD
LSGGSLYQHVDNHAGRSHYIITNDKRTISVSSAHHQMMNPEGTKFECLAMSAKLLSTKHLVEGDKDVPVEVEYEVVWFPETKALAMQYHPEFMPSHSNGYQYARELVVKYITT